MGSKLPAVIRAVPAIFWFGVQSWVGALALNGISVKLVGFDSPIFWFVAFQFLQIALAMLGFKGIKWIENIGSIFIVFSLGYMLWVIVTKHGAVVQSNVISIPGTWGLAFWGGTTAFLGVYTTLMLNISDYTREFKKSSSNTRMLIIHILGTMPTTLFMALIGLLSAGVTGKWDPIYLFVELMPNSFILILALLFIAMAQITTNVMLNVVPPAYVMMDMLGITYKKAAVITGLLAFLTFPWKVATATGFFTFIQIYSVFLGPIFAVLVVDYYFIRKKKLDINTLYDKTGPYRGINWAGIISVVVGSLFGALIELQLSWYIGLIPAGLTYYLLMKYSFFKKSSFSPSVKMSS
jgi:NCS1 family nucleobase:cation symporter-1